MRRRDVARYVSLATRKSLSHENHIGNDGNGRGVTTGTRPELLVVDPLLTAALLALAAWAVDPSLVAAQWQSAFAR